MARPEGEIINLVMHGNMVEVPYIAQARTLLVVGGDESDEMVGLVRRAADQGHEVLNIFKARTLVEASRYASVMNRIEPERLAIYIDGPSINSTVTGVYNGLKNYLPDPFLPTQFFATAATAEERDSFRDYPLIRLVSPTAEGLGMIAEYLFPQPASGGPRARRVAG